MLGLVLACASISATSLAVQGDCVILIHGAGRTCASMIPMQCFLMCHGYRVVNAQFTSTGRSIEEIADSDFPGILKELDPAAKVHFVAHSMGAIILRQYLASHAVTNLGRVVMLGPPNHGSEIIDRLRPFPLFRSILGRRLTELGTDSKDLPSRLGPAKFDCGVIAGDVPANPLTGAMLHGPNDGKVLVESARLDGMRDFLVVHHSHTWMIWNKDVMRQALAFLHSGAFDHNVTTNENSKQ